MIGTGYVGLVSGVCFSDLGNDVICVDRDLKKVGDLKKGIIPIYEPGLAELVLKNYKNTRLKFSTDLKDSISKSDIIFICVGTPTKKNGNGADLSQIYNVAKEIRSSISKFKIIITKSTVPVGYTASLSFNDGSGSTTIQIPAAQSFFNSTKDTMQIASSINYPATIGDVVITGGGTMELILPAGASSPSTGNGELYISIEYKEIATGSAFTL